MEQPTTTLEPKQPLAVPTVHLNGSGEENLLESYMRVSSALQSTLDALYAECPNGRDYYVQSDTRAFSKAVEQHARRVAAVRAARQEIEDIMEAIVSRDETRR